MNPRVIVFGLALWLGVVAVGSGATWLVVDHVGRDVVSAPQQPLDPAIAGGAVTHPAPTASPSASRTPSRRPRSRPTQAPDKVAPTPSVPAAEGEDGATTPGPSVTARPPRQPATKATQPRTPAPKAPPAVTRTWSGSAGRVTVRCTGARAALVSASPADGWRVEAGERGPAEVEVEFKRGGEGGEVHVKSRCSGGQPRFAVESDD